MNFLIKGQAGKPETFEVVTWGGDYAKIKDALTKELEKSNQTFVLSNEESGSLLYETVESDDFYKTQYVPSVEETS